MRKFGRFILYMLAAVGGLVTVTLVGLIVLAVTYSKPDPEVPKHVILSLDLDRGIVDGRSDDPWQELSGDETLYLRDVLAAMERAQNDERVVGLAVRLGSARIALAHAQELRDAITAFRASGKHTMAFAETFGGLGSGTSEYYLASSTDEVWMQPSGLLALIGIALETPFLKGALDKAGIKPEFEQRYEYKSAVELFTSSEMSVPSRQSLTRVLESWMRQIVSGIATDRKIEPDVLRATIDQAPLLAEEAQTAGLIDKIGYWETYSDAAQELGDGDAVPMTLLYYASFMGVPEEKGPDVALIYGIGPIEQGDAKDSPFKSERFASNAVADAIDDAVDDGSIRAIILRVDSPGGSYIGSDTVHRAVKRAREAGKPVIATMGSYGASGGYFVSMAADKIVALPTTLTGSIGVFGGKFSTADLWGKLGINWARVSVGANAGMWSQIYPFSPSAAERHRATMDFVYRDFTQKVAADRSLPEGRLDAVARGRVWTGVDALEVGLVDALGGFSVASDLVRDALELSPGSPLNIIVLPEQQSPFELVREAIADGVPLSKVFARIFAKPEASSYDVILNSLKPFVGDISVFRPPAGVLQLPPFRVVQ